MLKFKESEISYENVDHCSTRQRKIAALEHLLLALADVFHADHNLFIACHQIHSATHALDHFARDDPVRQVAFLVDLKSTQHCHVQVAAADDTKRLRGTKGRSARLQSHRLFARVD